MTYRDVLKVMGRHGYFDMASIVQLFDEPRETARTQVHRWCKARKLIALRRGQYAFADEYRRSQINPAELSNFIYTPSYLSLQWALSFYGIIPEGVVTFTAVTSRHTKQFENAFGVFKYRHLKSGAFFGSCKVGMGERPVRMATPEKALIDLWYLESGTWSPERMREMRFQAFELVDAEKLEHFADRIGSAKVHAAVQAWHELERREQQGTLRL